MGKVATLRSALAISDDRLIALGYARVAVRPAALRGTAWQANIGRNPLWQYLDLALAFH